MSNREDTCDILFRKTPLLVACIIILAGGMIGFSVGIYLEHRSVLQNYYTTYAKVTGYDVENKECVDCTMVCYSGPIYSNCARDCVSFPYTASASIQYFAGGRYLTSNTPGVCERYEEEAVNFLEREYPEDQPLFIYYLRSDPTKWYFNVTFKYTGYIIGIVLSALAALLLVGALIYNRRLGRRPYEGLPSA
jgi:hypothetical protein